MPKLFLDCDGVLADFDTHTKQLFGMASRDYEDLVGSKRFWRELEEEGNFYRNMPMMPDAYELFEAVKHLKPAILTGCPKGNWAQQEKIGWAEEHFPGVPVITCKSAYKYQYCSKGDVIIDDWPVHRHHWIIEGGIWISHYDAKTSLNALFAHYPKWEKAL